MNKEVFIAIWPKAHDVMSCEIKFLTRGYGTHAAFVRPSGMIAENFYPHVRERAFRFGERKIVEVYHLAGTTSDDWATLDEWIRRELLNPPEYSVEDLFRYALNMPPRHSKACFCSQWVMRGCRECLAPNKLPVVRTEYQDFVSPTQLRSSPLLIPYVQDSRNH
jgi:hypothetical protein